MEKVIRVKQIRGTQQTAQKQKLALRALGLYGIGSVNEIKDSPSVRGMLNAVHHMIEADLVDSKAAKTKKERRLGYTIG